MRTAAARGSESLGGGRARAADTRRRHALLGSLLLSMLLLGTLLLLGSPAAAAQRRFFAVYGLPAGQYLHVRASAHPRSRVRGTIPAEGRNLLATGKRSVRGGRPWREIQFADLRGWVEERFLVATPAPGAVATTSAAAFAAKPESPDELEALLASFASATPAVDGAGPVFDEDLVCYLNEPFWRIQITKAGAATCTETCDGPPDLRAALARPLAGAKDAWSLELRTADARPFMAVTVRRTGSCTESLSSDQYTYEVVARRPGGRPFSGCCNPMAGTKGAPPAGLATKTAWQTPTRESTRN
jgi:uncharacterized membrane protein